MEWGNDDSLHLIQEYSKHDLLWNPKHCEHFNKIKKADAWDEIAKTCSIGVEEAKKKMSSLLGSWRRERAKGKKIIGTGKDAREVYKTDWFAFKSFAFLMDRDDPRTSLSTATISDMLKKQIKSKSVKILQETDELEKNQLMEVQNEESGYSDHLIDENIESVVYETPEQATCQLTAIPFSNYPRKRRSSDSVESIIHGVKLAKILNDDRKHIHEFDAFCESLAIQLKKMPLQKALLCQAKLQEIMTQYRLSLLCSENPASSPQHYPSTPSPTTSVSFCIKTSPDYNTD